MNDMIDTTKMVTDEVVALATFQLPGAVIADCMAVSKLSTYIAYSPKANCVAAFIAPAIEVAESTYIHRVPVGVASALDA